MILKQQLTLTLNEQARFLDGIMLLDNDDIVVLATTQQNSKFQHYNKQSKLLKQYFFDEQVYGFKYLHKDQALFFLLKKKRIGIINFKLQEIRTLAFEFKSDSIWKNKLHVFPESGRYAIQQYPDYNKKYGRFTFFQYPFTQIWSVQVENTITFHIKPINQYSSLAFYRARVQNSIEFHVIDSDRQQIRKYSAPRPGGGDYVIKSITQLKPGQLFLFCDASINQYRNLVFNCYKHDQKLPGVIQKFKLDLPEKIYDVFASGEYMYFFQFDVDPKKQKQIDAPIILMNRQTSEIVYRSSCFITHDYNYMFSTEGQNKMYLFINSYHNCKKIDIRVEKVVKQKQLYLFMLTKLGQFDSNMLQSVIEAFQYD